MEEKLIGKVTHYYNHINVGIIKLSDTLQIGDTIHIKGRITDFNQVISSIEIEHKKVEKASAGELVGIKLDQKVHENDNVYKVAQ